MKLLYCRQCFDIFNLSLRIDGVQSCACGRTKGAYADEVNAWYSGDYAIPLGFANQSFIRAVFEQPKKGRGKVFKAFVIPVKCPTFRKAKK